MARIVIAVGFAESKEAAPEILYVGYDRILGLKEIEDAVAAGEVDRGELFTNIMPVKRVDSTSATSMRSAVQARSDAINAEAKKRLAAFVEDYAKQPENGKKKPSLEVQRKAMNKFMAELEASTPQPSPEPPAAPPPVANKKK